jgi:hypothetical protein
LTEPNHHLGKSQYLTGLQCAKEDSMNMVKPLLPMVACLIMVLPNAAMAGDFDGSRAITGTVDRLIEINRERVIENVDPDTVGLPKKFIIDFKARTMRPAPDSLVRRVVHIKRIDHIEDKLILQGADEGVAGTTGGLGWSLAIEKTTGRAVLSAAGSGIAFVAFGTCTPSSALR